MLIRICIFSLLPSAKELCDKFNQIKGIRCTVINEYTTNRKMRKELEKFDVVIVLPLRFDQRDKKGKQQYLDNIKLISYAIDLDKTIYAIPIIPIESHTTVKTAEQFFRKIFFKNIVMILGEIKYDQMKKILYIDQVPFEKIVSIVCNDFIITNKA